MQLLQKRNEAGGHIGKLTTMTLVRQGVAAARAPLFRRLHHAGRIADGEGVAAGFMLGAEAVPSWYAFRGSWESNAHQKYKES